MSENVIGNAATVKTDLEWPKLHYIDCLSSLKLDGEWRIVNKIWFQENREATRQCTA